MVLGVAANNFLMSESSIPAVSPRALDDSDPAGERTSAHMQRHAEILTRAAALISGDLALADLLSQLALLFEGLFPADRLVLVETVFSERANFAAHPALTPLTEIHPAYWNVITAYATAHPNASTITRAELQATASAQNKTLPDEIAFVLYAPLIQYGAMCGILWIESHDAAQGFVPQDAELVGALALYVGLALERERAVHESRRRMDQMGAFSAVTSTVNEWVDVEQLARRFLSVFLNTTHAHIGLFYLLHSEQDLHLVAHFGIPSELFEPLRFGHLDRNPVVKRAFEQGRSVVLENLASAALSRRALEIASLVAVESLMVLPLRAKGRGMGLILLGKSEGRIESADREFVQGLANQAAQAIENARLFSESQRRFQEQSALRELAQRFLSAVTPDEVLERTLDALMTLLPGDFYEVLLPAEEGAFLLSHGRGWRRGVLGRTHTSDDPRLHAGYVLRAQMPLVIESFATETRFQPSDYLMRHQAVSGVCAPMLAETRVIGLLGVYGRAARQFSEEQAHLLYLVATQTAMALEKARHSQSATRRLDELMLLNDVVASANAELALDRVLTSVTAGIGELLQSDDVRIYFARKNGDAQSDAHGEMHLEPALPALQNELSDAWSHSTAQWVVREKQSLLVQDLARDLRFNVPVEIARACLVVPMSMGERVIGVIAVAHPEPAHFDKNDLRLLTTLAGQIAAAIERARLLDETATRLAEISAMFEFSDKLRTALTEEQLHELIVRDAVKMLQGAGSSLQILSDDKNMLRVVATENMPHRGSEIPRARGGLSWIALETGEPFVIEDVSTDARVGVPSVFQEMHGGIIAPLRTPSGMVGTLFIGFPEYGEPGHDKLRLTTMIANLAAQVVQRLHLHAQTLAQAASLALALGDLEESYQATLLALSAALDARDRETEGHSQRVTKLALAIGRELKLAPRELTNLERGALLHDVGKIGVPDRILRKSGPLTTAEREWMNQHPRLGYEMLQGISFLQDALPVVLYHQEMWDGSGYPEGLRGEEIPLSARIFAVADTYDAMTSTRPYRVALTHQEALSEITRCRGTQFDPLIVDAFLALVQK